jgi:CRISPR/Cas system-associated endonuclease/helicase Cas3
MKKSHNLPGSVIVIDEFHSMPAALWGWMTKILKGLADRWNCKIVFLSGTPVDPWKIEKIRSDVEIDVFDVLSPNTSRSLRRSEAHRIRYELLHDGAPIHPDVLAHYVCSQPKSKLVICATVQNAALIAKLCENIIGENNVYHVSTALTPKDRRIQLEKVKQRLEDSKNDPSLRNFVLVGTSCIEAGVDISLDSGFFEAKSTMAMLQGSGRVDREHISNNAPCFVFSLADVVDAHGNEFGWITSNPMFAHSSGILIGYMKSGKVLNKKAIQEAFEEEVSTKDLRQFNADLLRDENDFALKSVREKVSDKSIQSFGIPMIVDQRIVDLITEYDLKSEEAIALARSLGLPERYRNITLGWLARLVQENSFPINVATPEDLAKRNLPYIDVGIALGEDIINEDVYLHSIAKFSSLYLWDGGYDEKYGYMNHVLSSRGVPGVTFRKNETGFVSSKIKAMLSSPPPVEMEDFPEPKPNSELV